MEEGENSCSKVSSGERDVIQQQRNVNFDKFNQVLKKLKESSIVPEDVNRPGFDDELLTHFARYPPRYASSYINAERPDDVLVHKSLLQLAKDHENRPAVEVRLVKIQPDRRMHEISIATEDKPTLLSQLTYVLSEDMKLHIQEAHAFLTVDGYSFSSFVVDGWPNEDTEKLKTELEKKLLMVKRPQSDSWEHGHASDGTDEWEIDQEEVKFGEKIASTSINVVYKGTYYDKEVAIKCLNPWLLDSKRAEKVFHQEVSIMRKINHKNIVQFIGACPKPPNVCIVTEYVSEGSLYALLRKRKGCLKLTDSIRVAIDIATGMDYLHQKNVIHRDLKTSNILMDNNGVAKVADFGTARVKSDDGVMTGNTGTWRWMAPEVMITHKKDQKVDVYKIYDQKVDVFSYGIILWELVTGKLPYSHLFPKQAACGVIEKDDRPPIPKNIPLMLKDLIENCWQKDPKLRPEFDEILATLWQIAEATEMDDVSRKEKSIGAFFSSIFKRK